MLSLWSKEFVCIFSFLGSPQKCHESFWKHRTVRPSGNVTNLGDCETTSCCTVNECQWHCTIYSTLTKYSWYHRSQNNHCEWRLYYHWTFQATIFADVGLNEYPKYIWKRFSLPPEFSTNSCVFVMLSFVRSNWNRFPPFLTYFQTSITSSPPSDSQNTILSLQCKQVPIPQLFSKSVGSFE